MRRFLFLIIFINSFFLVYSVDFYIEVTQMFSMTFGVDMEINEEAGLKFSLGASPFSIKTISYSALFYYQLPEQFDNFNYYIEVGLPIGYFDLIEDTFFFGTYVDWDDIIDDPYAGWLKGVTLSGEFYDHFILKAGVAYWTEWQRDSGFKNGVLPIISLAYKF